jgi:hypothetical protein
LKRKLELFVQAKLATQKADALVGGESFVVVIEQHQRYDEVRRRAGFELQPGIARLVDEAEHAAIESDRTWPVKVGASRGCAR